MRLKIAKTTSFRHTHQLEETQGPTSGWTDKSLLSKALISIMVYCFTTIIIDFPFGGGHILRSRWSHMCNALFQGATSGWTDKSLLSKALISVMVYCFTTIIDFPFGGGHILHSSRSHMCNALIAPICITIYCSNNQLLLRGSRHTLRLS